MYNEHSSNTWLQQQVIFLKLALFQQAMTWQENG
jgi:hypothetical protein